MRIFQTKWMARYTRRERINGVQLRGAIERAEKGLIDADLGGGLIKQRIARNGEGRSGGYRTIVAYRKQNRAVFLYGFARNDRENIGPEELETAREIASIWRTADSERIARGIRENEIQEIENGDQ